MSLFQAWCTEGILARQRHAFHRWGNGVGRRDSRGYGVSMRSGFSLLLLGSLLIEGCHESDRAPRELAYRGWRVGLPADSAKTLAFRDTGDSLFCGPSGGRKPLEPDFCMAGSYDEAPWVQLYVFLNNQTQRVQRVDLARLVVPGYTTDSLRFWLTAAWGLPDSVSRIAQREPVGEGMTTIWLGHWSRAGTYAYAYEMRYPEGRRFLRVELSNPEDLIDSEERMGLRIPGADRYKP